MKYIYLFLICITMQNLATAQSTSSNFTQNLGRMTIIQLNEVQGMADTKILIDATTEMLDTSVPDREIPNAVNAFLIRTESKNILVDTGFGSKLFDHLNQLGVSPEQIDAVLLTHMHGDHIGGMLKDSEKAFPNAKVYVSEKEAAYWKSDKANNKLALDIFSAYADQLILFKPGNLSGYAEELFPGIKPIEAYGHTPGHSMFLLESEGQRLLIWGDLTHALAVQIRYPEVAVSYDVDPAHAVKSRIETLKFVSQNDILIAGMHIPFSGMGRVTIHEAGGYLFTFLKN